MSLDLNYKPNVFVETANLTEDEWLAWRRKGVGGSDVAAALGLSPYRTARELYYDKIGVVPAVEGEDKSTLGELALRKPSDLEWYVKNYSGRNLALKAGAILLVDAASKMAS